MNSEKIDLHMQECIRLCWECRDTCMDTLYNHALQHSEHPIDGDHVRMMTDSIQMCQTAADFMRRNSPLMHAICNACSAVCEACADACEQHAEHNLIFQRSSEAARRCAEACRQMSQMRHAA